MTNDDSDNDNSKSVLSNKQKLRQPKQQPKQQNQAMQQVDEFSWEISSFDDLSTSERTTSLSPHSSFQQQSRFLTETQSRCRSICDDGTQQGQMMVVYTPQNEQLLVNPIESLSSDFATWCHTADALINSKEMEAFVSSIQDVLGSVGNVMFHFVCLPIAVPLHLSCETLTLVQRKCHQIQVSSTTLVHDVIARLQKSYNEKFQLETSEEEADDVDLAASNSIISTGESTSSDPDHLTPERIFHFVCKTTDKVKNEIGSSLVNTIVFLGFATDHDSSSSTGQSSSEKEDEMNNTNEYESDDDDYSFLDRLRLDYVPPNQKRSSTPQAETIDNASSSMNNDISDSNSHSDNGSNNSNCTSNESNINSNSNGKRRLLCYRHYQNHDNVPSSADTSKFLMYVADLDIILKRSLEQRNEGESPINDDDNDNSSDVNDMEQAQEQLLYIDLGKDFSNRNLTKIALDHIYVLGLSLFQNNVHAQLQMPQQQAYHPQVQAVQWKPEGSTAKLLRRKSNGTMDEWIQLLRKETLIWSGNFVLNQKSRSQFSHQHHTVRGRQENEMFLARGIVKGSPREVLHLLWDNTRTSEYNNFCMGRSNLLVLNCSNTSNNEDGFTNEYDENDNFDNVLRGSNYGTKIVKSETRVPFTGFSVILTTMMHVRPLAIDTEEHDKEEECKQAEEGSESTTSGNDSGNDKGSNDGTRDCKDGYIIISRTLDSGRAGCHTSATGENQIQEVKMKNEILWGINVLRPVPGHPHLTDLTSLSQVSSSMVPKFLSHNIGIMGVEDFFKNIKEDSSK